MYFLQAFYLNLANAFNNQEQLSDSERLLCSTVVLAKKEVKVKNGVPHKILHRNLMKHMYAFLKLSFIEFSFHHQLELTEKGRGGGSGNNELATVSCNSLMSVFPDS